MKDFTRAAEEIAASTPCIVLMVAMNVLASVLRLLGRGWWRVDRSIALYVILAKMMTAARRQDDTVTAKIWKGSLTRRKIIKCLRAFILSLESSGSSENVWRRRSGS